MASSNALAYASPLPESERSVSLATQGAIETFISQIASGQKNVQDLLNDEDDVEPDHPCNYCHKYHFFAGPRATPCPEGTKLPSKARHSRGHNRRGRREHLPNARCTKCNHRHWVSGSEATPCVLLYSLSRASSRVGTPVVNAQPKTPCKKCGHLHWFSGPYASSCRRSVRRAQSVFAGEEIPSDPALHDQLGHQSIKREPCDEGLSSVEFGALPDSAALRSILASPRYADRADLDEDRYDPNPQRADTAF